MIIKLGLVNGEVVWVDDATGEPCDVVVNAKGLPEKVVKTEADQTELMSSFVETPLSGEFEAYGFSTKNPNGETNEAILNQIVARLYPDGLLTISRLLDAVRCGLDAGSFVKPKPAEPVVRPRTGDGQLANAHWAEYQRMLNDPSVSAADITRKLNSNRDFRLAVEAGKAREAGAPAAAPSAFKDASNAEAILFARAFRRTANVHAIGGIHTLDYGNGEQRELTVGAFNERMAEAIECGAL